MRCQIWVVGEHVSTQSLLPDQVKQAGQAPSLGRNLNRMMHGALAFGIQAANPLQMIRGNTAATEDKESGADSGLASQ